MCSLACRLRVRPLDWRKEQVLYGKTKAYSRTRARFPGVRWRLFGGKCCIGFCRFCAGPAGSKDQRDTLGQLHRHAPRCAKPDKILVYDFAINPDDVQVDKVQSMRPRHLIAGDESPDAIAASASKQYSQELIKQLGKTGIPVEHMAKDAPLLLTPW